MSLTFLKVTRGVTIPERVYNRAYLQSDNWDDFGFKALFTLILFDEQGNKHDIGNLKIGFSGQSPGWSQEQIPQQFDNLPRNFFSLGQDADYYRNIIDNLSGEMTATLLSALGDVAFDNNRLSIADSESVFNTSLTRSVNRTSIEQQFRRILRGEAPLTEYDFYYEKQSNDRYAGVKVEFSVAPNTKPPTNIHILIGRNGVGKTTLLNNMVDALLPDRGQVEETGSFARPSGWGGVESLGENYFAGVVSVSFSAFDPFTPPMDQTNASAGMRYHYVGLKHNNQTQHPNGHLRSFSDLCNDFIASLKTCLALTAKRDRWVDAVRKLESDFNFAEMDLCQLIAVFDQDYTEGKSYFSNATSSLYSRMSSGHAIVLLSITKLVETVEEKTLVLIDEPESHLHPPLLSAFIRALSNLLENRNGVAIIATHSPVVLQEVPQSCVSVIRRTRLVANVDRPESETFAENVGVLTREVFGLEVSKSGFHDLLTKSVDEGKSFEEIEQEYDSQLGFEGKAILRALIMTRDLQTGATQ